MTSSESWRFRVLNSQPLHHRRHDFICRVTSRVRDHGEWRCHHEWDACGTGGPAAMSRYNCWRGIPGFCQWVCSSTLNSQRAIHSESHTQKFCDATRSSFGSDIPKHLPWGLGLPLSSHIDGSTYRTHLTEGSQPYCWTSQERSTDYPRHCRELIRETWAP